MHASRHQYEPVINAVLDDTTVAWNHDAPAMLPVGMKGHHAHRLGPGAVLVNPTHKGCRTSKLQYQLAHAQGKSSG